MNLPVPRNITSYSSRFAAITLSTAIWVYFTPCFINLGRLLMGVTKSSIKGWSRTNWSVLSGRSREVLMPLLRISLLIHYVEREERDRLSELGLQLIQTTQKCKHFVIICKKYDRTGNLVYNFFLHTCLLY